MFKGEILEHFFIDLIKLENINKKFVYNFWYMENKKKGLFKFE